ncbi:unnamed protein product [Nesidiocoris tenuis]|uniref:Uncharacterized protein n=1 Tax=Nesidiocoris tenuis TaxID=355587 RepID=A0A6H5HEC3_9HEMI|nr:unnamed protein product [Nesidiocoris tenuis]
MICAESLFSPLSSTSFPFFSILGGFELSGAIRPLTLRQLFVLIMPLPSVPNSIWSNSLQRFQFLRNISFFSTCECWNSSLPAYSSPDTAEVRRFFCELRCWVLQDWTTWRPLDLFHGILTNAGFRRNIATLLSPMRTFCDWLKGVNTWSHFLFTFEIRASEERLTMSCESKNVEGG